MQEDFGMGEHHEELFFLGQSESLALVQLLIATDLPKELLELTVQTLSILRVGILSIGEQLAIELPEAVFECLQGLTIDRDVWDQLLVMAKFVNPAQG